MKLRRPHPYLVLSSALLLASLTGCSMIKVQGQVSTTHTTADGRTVTKTQDFHSFEEMTAALDGAASDLADTTSELAKQLTAAPPPGEVKLGDLSPDLADYQGKAGYDFLASAPDKKFSYVRIGVASYDDFFKSSAELYALTYQLRATVEHLEAPGDANPEELRKMASVIGQLAASAAGKIEKLVATGQALVTGAPASITNPKTALHLKLIVKGLEQSVKLVSESAKPLGELATHLPSMAAHKAVAAR